MLLFDLIDLEPEKCKIHLAVTPETEPTSDPLEAFYEGKFKRWQNIQRKRNFTREYVVSLIRYKEKDKWLFAGVWLVDSEPPSEHVDEKGRPYFLYKTELTDHNKDMIDRLVVRYKLKARNVYRNADTICDELEVFEVH